MSPTPLLLALAAVTVVVAVRQAVRSRRRGDAAWRLVVLVAGQFALAALLAMFLFPPARGVSDGTLVVLTADAPRPPAGAGADHVALPEAPTHPGIARVPDLGTALRRHPGTRAIRVVGAGLPARDRDAALGVRVVFEPAPLPAGVVALHAPVRVGAGRRFTVTGRVHGAADARMELLDPAGRRVARVPVAADGGFAVSAIAGPAGFATWTLRHRDAADAVAGTIGLPVEVVPGAPLRILALAGGIGPEQKYLARWALDAGLSLQARANVGGGVDIGGAVPPLSPDGLREVDGVILDDRAWRSLGAGGRAALLDAVRDGVGVLVRLTGDPGAADREAWAAWGFTVARADIARDVTLAEAAIADASPVAGEGGDAAAASGASVDAAAARHAPVTLSRRAVAITAADGAPLLRDADGTALAVWRAEGRGRIAVWNLSDTFRLQLAGRRAAYGSLWAEATGTLARARDDAASDTMPRDARVGARVALCGLGDTATLVAPDGSVVALRVDPATGEAACAAAWPTAAGWHALHDGDRVARFPVRAMDEAPGLVRAAMRDATLALAARAGVAERPAGAAPTHPGPRWPWLLAWLAVAAGLWWLERSRAGAERRTAFDADHADQRG